MELSGCFWGCLVDERVRFGVVRRVRRRVAVVVGMPRGRRNWGIVLVDEAIVVIFFFCSYFCMCWLWWWNWRSSSSAGTL